MSPKKNTSPGRWFATLSLPIVIGLWLLASLILFVGGVTSSTTETFVAVSTSINRVLGMLALLSLPLTILGIIMLVKKDDGLIGQSIQAGRTGAKKHIGVWAVLLIIYLIAIIFSTVLFGEGLLDTLLTQILGLLLAVFAYTGAIRFIYHKTVVLGECFDVHPIVVLKYIVGTILYRFMVLLGLILFIIPGVIIGIRAGFVPLAILKEGLGPIDAIEYSLQITKGKFWQLLGLAVVQGLIQIVGVLALLVGLFWTMPTAWISEVKAYQLLTKKTA